MQRVLLVVILALVHKGTSDVVQRSDFPDDFFFGTATAAYQIEGGYQQDGRGMSIWDTFSHIPGKVADNETGDVADDHYNRVDEDIALMVSLGIKYYRMSLSWSRIMPTGRYPINVEGFRHYEYELNKLVSAGITPYVTLYHWDLPQALEDEGGWLNASMVEAFQDYADFCFQRYGHLVRHWITINEPNTVATQAYDTGIHAPGRCTDRSRCDEGDSSTEPYIVAYNLLNAHAAAGASYIRKHGHHGFITITLDSAWAEPLNSSDPGDLEASQRSMDFNLGWWADPLYFGDWPESMKYYVGDRLPVFTTEQKNLLLHSHNFFGLNHYTTFYVSPVAGEPEAGHDVYYDMHIAFSHTALNGTPIGPMADSDWLYVVPWGFQKLVDYVYDRYKAPIVITENGVDSPGENDEPIEVALQDTFRQNYYQNYLHYLSEGIKDGADVIGYFAWSLMDNFEWADGYSKRFGMTYVDYANNNTRYPKDSAKWYSEFINA